MKPNVVVMHEVNHNRIIHGTIWANLLAMICIAISYEINVRYSMLDLLLKILGVAGFFLGAYNTVAAAQRLHQERYPKLNLWIQLHRKRGGKGTISIEVESVGFGDVPELDHPKILFADGKLHDFGGRRLSRIVSKGGKHHSYDLGQLNDALGQAKECFMYSNTTQRCYFSKSFPHTHRLYKVRRSYKPPIVLGEFKSDSPGHKIEGQDVGWAQLLEYNEILTRVEKIQRWLKAITGIGKPIEKPETLF